MWLSAGEVTFKVNDMGSQYHVAVAGRTYKSYEWFFKVRDYYDTYIDTDLIILYIYFIKTNTHYIRIKKYIINI